MVANWVYWRRISGASKRIFATIKSTIDAMKYSNTIQLSSFKCNHVLLHCWQDDVSGNHLKYLMIFNRGIDTMKITALSNHQPGIWNNYIRILIWCEIAPKYLFSQNKSMILDMYTHPPPTVCQNHVHCI